MKSQELPFETHPFEQAKKFRRQKNALLAALL
jgi:hypothetical protein